MSAHIPLMTGIQRGHIILRVNPELGSGLEPMIEAHTGNRQYVIVTLRGVNLVIVITKAAGGLERVIYSG